MGRHVIAKYDSGIRFADQKLAELLAKVDFSNTPVVFTSDHGEGFSPELGRVHHCGRLHDDCRIEISSDLRYPLKHIIARRNQEIKEFYYNLATDPKEQINLLTSGAKVPPSAEPITFVVAVNDKKELELNLLASSIYKSQLHEWLLIDIPENSKYYGISDALPELLRAVRK